MEIGFRSAANVDTGRKRDLYAELGVREYWRYDSTGGEFYGEPLVSERLVDGKYRRIEISNESDGRVWGRSEALNLEMWWEQAELRFWDPVAELWLLNPEEEHDTRLEAESRAHVAESPANVAEAHAEEERDARLETEARLAELQAKLRRLRGE